MAAAEWEQILELFHAAREKAGSERVALLDNACGEGTPLRKAVEELLKENETADGFLSKPIFESLNDQGFESSVLSGQRFGRYVIRDLLGRGGMGEVWSAHDTDLDRPVALKFLSSRALAILDSDHITREARAASALNHPNIVTIYEVVQSESTFAIVMELVEGSSLRQVVGERLPAGELIEIGSQIARALAAAHGGNIVHGDIKPENILLRRDRYVKVLDFGLARRITTETTDGSPSLGTLRYMSPEQAREEPLTPASDIFSFGLVLYELATGIHAFPARSPVDTVQAILRNESSPPSAVNPALPPALDPLIAAMLAKEAAARPSAEEVTRQLRASLETIQPNSPAPKLLGNPKRPGPSSRPRYRRAAMLAVVAAALVGGLWFNRRPQQKPAPIRLTPVPLTTGTGFHSWPDISPDGEAVVYGWGASSEAFTHLYIKRFDEDAPMKLVQADPGFRIGHAKWSRDGGHVYYKRTSPQDAGESIWVVSKDASERRQIVSLVASDLSSGIDCSPDGKRIVYSDKPIAGSGRYALESVSLVSGEKTLLTAPKQGWGDWDPRFSPDGKTIAFKRVTASGDDQLYVMPAAGGTARQITSGRHSIFGHGWLTGGELLLSIQWKSMIHGLWRMAADGSGEAESVFQSGLDAVMPAIRNKKVVWINQIDDYNIYSVALTGGEPVKRIASPMFDSEPSLAPDGRIAYVSRRSGSPEIWIAASNTANSVRITNLKGDVGRPAWSPDGSRIAFSMQRFGVTTILSTHCTPGGLRCESPAAVIEGRDPAWSANGRFLYFTANLPDQIWRVPISGGPAMYVARGIEALASRDGRWLYVRRAPVPEFYRVGLDADGGVAGSEERVLVRKDNGADLEHWALAGDEIIFPENSINSSFSGLRAYNTVTKQLRTIVESATAKCPAVSPDGKTVWFAQSDATGATVMAAEFSQ